MQACREPPPRTDPVAMDSQPLEPYEMCLWLKAHLWYVLWWPEPPETLSN